MDGPQRTLQWGVRSSRTRPAGTVCRAALMGVGEVGGQWMPRAEAMLNTPRPWLIETK
eukprot:gene43502-60345_t